MCTVLKTSLVFFLPAYTLHIDSTTLDSKNRFCAFRKLKLEEYETKKLQVYQDVYSPNLLN